MYFNYEEAFSRNLGWFTQWEQQLLRSKKVAIAGVGGVGGVHLLTLARMGIGQFHIADNDQFELANFNRQTGAMLSTLGEDKVDVMRRMATDINPQALVKVFPMGINEDNLDDFLCNVDLYVDGLDAFLPQTREMVFKRCHELGIPAITAAPLGMGTAYIIFMPGQMSFREYFALHDLPVDKKVIKFLLRLSPQSACASYLADASYLDIKARKGPSTPIACQLAAGVTGAAAAKILLGRGKIFAAPWYHYFDPYANKWALGRLGARSPIQALRFFVAQKLFSKSPETQIDAERQEEVQYENDIEHILDLAKWTPSGDNAQPWQFHIQNEEEVIVNIKNEGSLYDYNGLPSLLTVGMLLESLKIAASHFNREMLWEYSVPEEKTHQLKLTFLKKPSVQEDPLFPFMKVRSVNRGCYQFKALSAKQKSLLEEALGDRLNIQWIEKFGARWQMAGISALATDIRLRIRETYAAHKIVVDFDHKFSACKIPSASLGVCEFTQRLMKWAMESWTRLDFMNTFLCGTLVPRIEMDYMPGLFSSGYFIVNLKKQFVNQQDKTMALLKAGGRIQRFWLQITKLGLSMQPAVGCTALAYYGKNNITFTKNPHMQKKAGDLAQRLGNYASINDIVFMGRVGFPKSLLVTSRSVRKPLGQLLVSPKADLFAVHNS